MDKFGRLGRALAIPPQLLCAFPIRAARINVTRPYAARTFSLPAARFSTRTLPHARVRPYIFFAFCDVGAALFIAHFLRAPIPARGA